MKIITRTEWVWDGKLYQPVKVESFDYHGPVVLAKSDPLGAESLVQTSANHVENTIDLYNKDPERPFLGINTPFESAVWENITGKEYEPTMDMYGGDSKYDYKTANEKGIDTGPAEFYHGIARTIVNFYGGQAIGGAMGGGETLSGTSEGTTLGGDIAGDTSLAADGATTVGAQSPVDATASTASATSPGAASSTTAAQPTIAEQTAGVDTNAGSFLDSSGVPDTGSGASAADTTAAEQNFAQGAQQQQAGSKGLIESGLNFVKENPITSLGAMHVGSGIIQGIGNNMTQNELADKKLQSEKEILEKKAAEERALIEWRRQFIQGGSTNAAKLHLRPVSNVLRRPDGTPVYATGGGLIAAGMNPGGV